MENKYIKSSFEKGIVSLQINRPEALNALNSAVSKELYAALEEICLNTAVRAIILTGNAKAFAAGADIKEMSHATPREARDFSNLAIKINDLLESLPIPTIAAVSGYAFGGGFEMALACDFRVGGPKTKLMFPEMNLGIIPGANGCARITALVGSSKAKELVFLTPLISGEDAYKLGLLNRYVEEDDNIYVEALKLAEELASKPACALAAAKAAINKAANETISSGKNTETSEFALLFDTHDQKEGMAAMLEKRKAEFLNH